VWAFLACCGTACALNPSFDINQYAHKSWTVRDGFFKGGVITVAQTQDGYLWVGTESGLFRFDGLQAVAWRPPANQPLPSANIRRLLVTRDGRLWIGTDKGLASWKDGTLTSYPRLAQKDILALLEDHEGTVWAGGYAPSVGRLCAIRGDNSTCYGEDGSLGRGVISLYEQKHGGLWVGSQAGLWHWSPGPPKHYPVSQSEPAALTEDENGDLLIAGHDGIKHFVNGRLESYPLPGAKGPFPVDRLLRDHDGGVWIATVNRGLLHIHKGKADSFARVDGLSSDDVIGLLEDREGNIWTATDRGLDRFHNLAVPAISLKQGLSNADVTSVLAAADGSVWLGTPAGLNRWKDGQMTVFRKQHDGLPDNTVGALFQDESGRIWVTTYQGSAYFENGRFVTVSDVPAGVVFTFAGAGDGGLWMAHQDQGLIRLHEGRMAERISWSRLGRKDFAYTMAADSDGRGLWLGFAEGGVMYYKDGQVRRTYGSADGLGQGRVIALQPDPDGSLWAATQGGLSRIANNRVSTLSSRNGLPCDKVQWAEADAAHFLWLGMACGIVRISRAEIDAWEKNPAHEVKTMVLDGSDGVGSFESSYSPKVASSGDGRLWLTSLDGVGIIDPQHLPVNKLPPPVSIEQIIADRKPYGASPNRHLPALTRDLQIDYTALSLVEPEKNRFRVRLEGHDRDWKDMGDQRKVFYNDLPPRNYRFRVMAGNNSGVWNEAGAAFDFSIDPAYYQTRWFQASCVAAFLGLLWALYRLRLRQIAQGFNARMEERVGERTRIARELHDTLLQSFQGLMLRLQVVDDLLPEGRAKEELEQSLERADQAIAEGREAVHDLRMSASTTNDLAHAVRALGDELAVEEGAAFRLLVEGTSRDLHPIVRDEIYRIAREAIRNAFSHAHARHIEVEITYAERLLRLRIRDDGQGIAPAILEQGRSGHYGLPGMRERAGQIGAKLSIWSAPGAGTEIELNIAASIAYGKSAGSRLRLFRKAAG